MTRQETSSDSDNLRKLYDADYVEHFEKNSHLQSERIKKIVEKISVDENDVVADFGCGNGLLASFIYDEVKAYYGVDFSEEFIDAFRKKIKRFASADNIHLFASDILEFCKERPQFFDKAFTLDLSEHIYDEDFMNIYQAIHRSLKNGGVLYLHTPNREYFLEILKNIGVMKQFPGHIGVRSAASYVNMLKKIGFIEIKINYLPHYNILKYFHFLSYLPFLGKYFRARLLITCRR
jgi:2-polyprenyl-6-hydroxyphenyl methylase / 3-demethylubiquinone-9 3-methyltransferase